MVVIVDYKESVNSETQESYFSLVLEGEIEMVQSKETGRFYATSRRATIPSTFTEERIQLLLGTTMRGSIVKMDCEPYDYVVPESGDIIELNYCYQYVPNENEISYRSKSDKINKVKADTNTFSTNGKHELVG